MQIFPLKYDLTILFRNIFVIVITIKSSLVLSLGLVGALSIIRFRTAVKEPEQLVYYLVN